PGLDIGAAVGIDACRDRVGRKREVGTGRAAGPRDGDHIRPCGQRLAHAGLRTSQQKIVRERKPVVHPFSWNRSVTALYTRTGAVQGNSSGSVSRTWSLVRLPASRIRFNSATRAVALSLGNFR